MTAPALPADPPADGPAYVPRRHAESRFVPVRGLRYHLLCWGDPAQATPERPLRVMMHGWMDVGASFQFVVDALGDDAPVIAPDWRGFGLTDDGPGDTYWFADYLADLDSLLDALSPDAPVDLLGHSMGGNAVMLYAGARPARVRRLINLEGFGMPASRPTQYPGRLARWMDELKTPQRLATYSSVHSVAQRLRHNNPRLGADKAAWLAPRWSRPDEQGRWHILGDADHKRGGPLLYQADEVVAAWRCITAPVLWVEGAQTDIRKWWGELYPRAEFEARLAEVPRLQRERLEDCGHMLHHDQPERLAALIARFLAEPEG